MTQMNFQSASPNPHFNDVEDIAPEELKEKLSAVHLIDVRRPDEYTGDLGHIKGAQLVVLDTLPEKFATLPTNGTIVFVCRSGARSAQASAFARENGLTNVYNMQGGMLRWNQLGLPIEK